MKYYDSTQEWPFHITIINNTFQKLIEDISLYYQNRDISCLNYQASGHYFTTFHFT